MFKNLYRLRLLDFFELTAATAGALYVYQSGGWQDFEKYWVIGALVAGALVIWPATRIGKSEPMPGLFLASCTGALYGLLDLTPWLVLFDYDEIRQMISDYFGLRDFLSHWTDGPLLASLLAIVIFVPATTCGAIWLAANTAVHLVAKRFSIPSNLLAKRRSASMLYIAGLPMLLWFWMWVSSPAFHVRSVQIPYLAQVATPPQSNDGYAELNSTCSWTISEDRKKLIVLYSDKRLVEYDASSGAPLRSIALQCPSLAESCQHLVTRDGKLIIGHHDQLFEMNGIDQFAKIWSMGDERLLICADHLANAPAQYQIYDLRTGNLDAWAQKLKLTSRIRAVSVNGTYAVVEEHGDDPLQLRFSVWNLKTRQRQSSPGIELPSQTDAEFAISNQGTFVRIARKLDAPLIPGEPLPTAEPQKLRLHLLSDDGDWGYSDDQEVFEERIVLDSSGARIDVPCCDVTSCHIGRADRTPVPHTRSGKLVLLQNDLALFQMFSSSQFSSELPIFRTLGERAYRSRVFMYDPAARKASSTSIWPIRFQHLSCFSAKFSPCGRYLWVMDEYDKGYVFHEFAIR